MSTRRGFSLVEATISIVIVGGALAASMHVAAAAAGSRARDSFVATGRLLAEDLLAEIVILPYCEPTATPNGTIGPEIGEALDTTRSRFDDVDDYHGWTSTTLQARDGTAIPNMGGWQRRVSVVMIAPGTLRTPSAGETGTKRITVTVEYRGRPIASAWAIRTRARDLADPIYDRSVTR